MSKLHASILGTTLGCCVLTLLCIQSKPALAAPDGASITTYYSDATYKYVVGYTEVNCSYPFIVNEGTKTIYSRYMGEGNCDPK
jgi:hypothetical protein